VSAAPAPATAETARLSRLAPDYDAILCDVWGVIRDGERVVPEALDALVRFRQGGGRVLLLSNSPRRCDTLVGLLREMGAPDGAWDGAVTSGDATRALLKGYAPGPLYRLGADFDAGLYDGLDVTFGPLSEAVAISCTGLEDYFNETPDDYRDLLTEAKLRRLPLVCANPDIVVQGPGGKLLWCAGALARLYEELGGEALYAGKPGGPDRRPGRPFARARGRRRSGHRPARRPAGGAGRAVHHRRHPWRGHRRSVRPRTGGRLPGGRGHGRAARRPRPCLVISAAAPSCPSP
jgi:HAD superfamily hydrolase (TIGR01459 family)